MGNRRYELSAKYAGGEAVHVATLATVTYLPGPHKIASIALYYERPFMQFVFDSIHPQHSFSFLCVSLSRFLRASAVDGRESRNAL